IHISSGLGPLSPRGRLVVFASACARATVILAEMLAPGKAEMGALIPLPANERNHLKGGTISGSSVLTLLASVPHRTAPASTSAVPPKHPYLAPGGDPSPRRTPFPLTKYPLLPLPPNFSDFTSAPRTPRRPRSGLLSTVPRPGGAVHGPSS